MTRDFWLGVGVLPGLAAIGLGLWFVLRSLNRGGAWLVNQLRFRGTERAPVRAGVGAAVASARRTVWIPLPFDAVLVLALGHDFKQVNAIRDAIYGVLVPPATVSPKWRRGTRVTVEPRSDHTAEEE